MAVDPYGGIKALRGKATGAFHLEKVGERDCLVTPDGHGFLSLGVVHIGAIQEPSKIDLFHDQYGGDWKRVSEAAVGQAYAYFLERAFAKPYIVGFHRCQYIDRFVQYQGVLKQGLLRENGRPYEALVNHVRDANLEQMRRFAQRQAHEGTRGDTGATLP